MEVGQFHEFGRAKVVAPSRPIVEDAIAVALPAFLAVAAGIRAEEHAARLQRAVQLPQHTRQFLARHVEQRRVGEHAVEVAARQGPDDRLPGLS